MSIAELFKKTIFESILITKVDVIMFIKVMENKYITIKQAAKILNVTPLTLRNWDNSGKFPAGRHPISNYRVYKIEDIEEIIVQMGTKINNRKPSRDQIRKLVVNHLTD